MVRCRGREIVLLLLCKVGFGAHGHALTQSISQQKPLPTQHSTVVFMHFCNSRDSSWLGSSLNALIHLLSSEAEFRSGSERRGFWRCFVLFICFESVIDKLLSDIEMRCSIKRNEFVMWVAADSRMNEWVVRTKKLFFFSSVISFYSVYVHNVACCCKILRQMLCKTRNSGDWILLTH